MRFERAFRLDASSHHTGQGGPQPDGEHPDGLVYVNSRLVVGASVRANPPVSYLAPRSSAWILHLPETMRFGCNKSKNELVVGEEAEGGGAFPRRKPPGRLGGEPDAPWRVPPWLGVFPWASRSAWFRRD